MARKKIKLSDLKIKSFIVGQDEQKGIKGGYLNYNQIKNATPGKDWTGVDVRGFDDIDNGDRF